MTDAWEALRHLTLDQLLTQVKLHGAAGSTVRGRTTPEGWPFVVTLVIGRPGSEDGLTMAEDFVSRLQTAARWTKEANNPKAQQD